MNPQENNDQPQATPLDNSQAPQNFSQPQTQAPQPESTLPPAPQPQFQPQTGMAPQPPAPSVQDSSEPQPFGQPVVGTVADPALLATSPDSLQPSNKKKKIILISSGAVLAVLAILVGFYFLYWMNPKTVYNHALANTGSGLTGIVEHFQSPESQNAFKSYDFEGSVAAGSSDNKFEGSITGSGSGKNMSAEIDVKANEFKVGADILSIGSQGKYPDYYFKISGIKDLFSSYGMLSESDFYTKILPLDNTWIAIDHSYLDNLEKSATKEDEASQKQPSKEQILDAVYAISKVNEEYVFSTDKNKSILEQREYLGKEKVDGHSTQHYKMGFSKDNTKQYIEAVGKAVMSSDLGAWIKENKYQKSFENSVKELANSTKEIKHTDTFDMWVDRGNRVIYKIRVYDGQNNAKNKDYVELGFDYKEGDELPFFIKIHDRHDGEATLKVTFNQKTNKFSASYDGGSASSKEKYEGNFVFQPSSEQPKIEKPKTSKSIQEVMSSLGFDDSFQPQAE